MGCFTSIVFLAGFLFIGISMIRWFEQTAEAVDARQWRHLLTLIFFPFAVWMFPSRISAGRPTPFPLHERVRGFGTMSLAPKAGTQDVVAQGRPAEAGRPPVAEAPKAVPKVMRKSGIDPEQVAKLKEKMRQQGMLPPEE